MPIPENKKLYEKAKKIADDKYEKPSAYKSGFIVKTYKELGGTYKDDNKEKNLKRWFKEDWGDIGGKDYPVYRPSKRINEKTPLTVDEIDPKQAKEQIKLKQIIKGDKNLPKFEGKGININKYSNPETVFNKAKKIYGKDVEIKLSDRDDKKYMLKDPKKDRWFHFGQIGFEDFTKHKDKERRDRFLDRNKKWAKFDKYTPAYASYYLLW